MKYRKHLVAAACLLASAGAASAIAGPDRGLDALNGLRADHPGSRVWNDGERNRILYGVPMTTAATPRLASERFLSAYGEAFGAGSLELDEVFDGDVSFGRFHVFHYTQRLQGLPVELSPGRVLTRANDDGTWSVVYAAGLFAGLPEGGFAPLAMSGSDAIGFVRRSGFGRLPRWSGAELVAYQLPGPDGVVAARAWKFVGENPDLVEREKYTFFVDAATGALLEARDEVLRADVFGFVTGYASPGRLPDEAGNPPVLLPVNNANVQIQGGNSGYADADGYFDITHGGTSNVTITSNFDLGQWCNINNQGGGGVLTASATATPGTEAALEYNSTPTEFETAQVNAFIHTGKIHNFITDRTSWTGMNFRCTTNVNIASSCNAYFDGSSINFYRRAGGCNNTAYSTVVAHEYGHYIVSRLGLAQGAFGEGFGDCCSEMLYDTGIVGEHFFTSGGFIRDNDNTIRTYPCSGAVHYCGQLLGGVWWHIREPMGVTYGSQQGLEITQQLFADWMLITSGGQGDNSAHPGTAIEVLTIDDDDGNINNGTPNYDDICAGFDLHNIDCPDIIPLVFYYPDGVPTLVSPSGGTTFRVQIYGNAGFEPEPGTGVLHVDTGSGFVDLPMTELSDNVYDATFPAIECFTDVSFYLSGRATDGTIGRDPLDGAADPYAAYAAESRSVVVDLDFETGGGFTVSSDGGVTAGAWQRGNPFGNNGGAPTSDYDGSGSCFVTGNGFGGPDLDGGATRLVSPEYDMTGLANPTLTFARWFHNSNPQDGDTFTVEASDDGGQSWVVIESVGHQGNQWTVVNYELADYVSLTDSVVVRFTAVDQGADSLTEAGVDALLIQDVDCGGCVADFNGDGDVNTLDVLAFLNAYTAGDPDADVNGDGSVNTLDVLLFLNLWNAGC